MSLLIHLRFSKSPNSQKFPLESNLETFFLKAFPGPPNSPSGFNRKGKWVSRNPSANSDRQSQWQSESSDLDFASCPPLKSYSPQEQEPRLTCGTPAPTYTHTKGRSFTPYSVLGLGEVQPSRVLYSSDQKEESGNKITCCRLRKTPPKLMPGVFSPIAIFDPQARRGSVGRSQVTQHSVSKAGSTTVTIFTH